MEVDGQAGTGGEGFCVVRGEGFCVVRGAYQGASLPGEAAARWAGRRDQWRCPTMLTGGSLESQQYP